MTQTGQSHAIEAGLTKKSSRKLDAGKSGPASHLNAPWRGSQRAFRDSATPKSPIARESIDAGRSLDRHFVDEAAEQQDREFASPELLDLLSQVERNVVGWLPKPGDVLIGRLVDISEAES